MKQREVEIVLTYRWWSEEQDEVDRGAVSTLDERAEKRISEMSNKGHTSGELDTVVGGVYYRGHWERNTKIIMAQKKNEYNFTVAEPGKRWVDIGSETRGFINMKEAEHYGSILSAQTGRTVKVQKVGSRKFSVLNIGSIDTLIDASNKRVLKFFGLEAVFPPIDDDAILYVTSDPNGLPEITIHPDGYSVATNRIIITEELASVLADLMLIFNV